MLKHQISAFAIVMATFATPSASGATALTGYTQAVAEAAFDDPAVAAYYRDNGYAPIWTGSEGAVRRAALLHALSQADAHGLPTDRYRPEELISAFRGASTERDIGFLEVTTTRMFLAYAQDIQSGALEPTRIMGAEIKRELPRRDQAETLAAFVTSENPALFLRQLAPTSGQYVRLMREKARLERLILAGGWGPEVSARGKLEPGDGGSAIIALRNRLIRMGYLARTVTPVYDSAMTEAVRLFQASHGLEEDGVVGPGTLDEINVSAEDRLKSVVVGLERERWMNFEEGLGQRHVWVNLADFHALIVDDGKVTFRTRSVVGQRRPDLRTYEFSDMMEYMEVNPDWTVPRSIIVKEYLPDFQENPESNRHLQIIDRSGRIVPREALDFTQFNAVNFPFDLRQPPGSGNALGRVKFMFPNAHAIYLHDTPQKYLFARESRAYSHGCIRLADPFDFAYALLARQMDDPEPFFDDLVRSGRQTRVDIEQSFPVHLVYFTAFADGNGKIQYRRDVYDRDRRLFAALVEAGVVFPGHEG